MPVITDSVLNALLESTTHAAAAPRTRHFLGIFLDSYPDDERIDRFRLMADVAAEFSYPNRERWRGTGLECLLDLSSASRLQMMMGIRHFLGIGRRIT